MSFQLSIQAAGRQIDVLLAPAVPDAGGDTLHLRGRTFGKSILLRSMIFTSVP